MSKRMCWVVEIKQPGTEWATYALCRTRNEARSEVKMEQSWYPPRDNDPRFRVVCYTPIGTNPATQPRGLIREKGK